MDQMMKLDSNQLNHLRDIFEQRPDGLSMEDFISVMSKALPNTNDTRLDEHTVHSLRELFLQVDVNGDGTMEWDEFTGFCIDQGIAATVSHSSSAIPDQLYVEQTKFVDKTRAFDSSVKRIDWVPELDKIFVSESNCNYLKVYDPNRGKRGPQFLHQIKLDHSKSENHHETKGARKDKIKLAPAKGAQAKESVRPTCVEYIPSLGLIAVAMSDIAISFWDTGVYRRDPDNGIPWFVKRIHTEKLVLKMTWCAPIQTLFTCGGLSSGMIIAWKVTIEGQNNTLFCRKIATLKGHSDVVTDLLSVVKMRGTHVDFCCLVSCSLDKKVIVWDTETYTIKGKRTGHKRGVRSLGLVSGKNDGCLVLSSGFDSVVLLWEVGGLADKPLMRLTGHIAPVVQARMHSDGRLVSVDDLCIIKWWHVGSNFSDNNNAECIQTVLPFTGMGNRVPVPTTVVVAGNAKRILVGAKTMRVFDLVRVRPKSQPAVGILYNRSSMTVIAAQARNVRTWDAKTGQLQNNFHDCCDHKVSHDADISALCLDRRHRKFVTADLAGSVSVFNFMNGALMKRSSLLHGKEVSDMIYCEEDQCIITGSWDRSFKILDEDAGNNLPTLRTVNMAHEFDISALAHSHTLNLVATGDSNGVVKIWDFQFVTHEGTCSELDISGQGAEVTCMAFLEPYPLLAVADSTGGISLYTVRPWYAPYKLISKTYNTITDVFDQTTKWPITTMRYKYHSNGGEEIAGGITTGQCLLFVGDENGNIGVYDFMPFITASKITAIREKDMPTRRNNYNARRRSVVYGEGFQTLEMYENYQEANKTLLEKSRGSSISHGNSDSSGEDSDNESWSSNRKKHSKKIDNDLSDTNQVSLSPSLSSSLSLSSLPPIHRNQKNTTFTKRRKSSIRKNVNQQNTGNSPSTMRKSASAMSMGLGSAAGSSSMMAARKARVGREKMRSTANSAVENATQKNGATPTTLKKQRSSESFGIGALQSTGKVNLPEPTLIAQWAAHEGTAITALDVNIDDGFTKAIPFIISSGEDLVVRTFSLSGKPLGFLTKGDEADKLRRKPYPWTCLVDVNAQMEEEQRITKETRELVVLTEAAERKALEKAEANRIRAEKNAALAKSRPVSPKETAGTQLFGDDVEWLISKGSSWEECDGRLKSALEIAHQADLGEKQSAAEKLAAELAATEEAGREAPGKKKKKRKIKVKKKKQQEVWTDSEEEDNEDEQKKPEPGILINVRGNKFMFDPDGTTTGGKYMTLKSLDKVNSDYQRLKRKDGSAALAEKKKIQAKQDKDRSRVVGQLMGEKTWVLSDLERGRMLAEAEEQEKKRLLEADAKNKQSAQQKKDAEMMELLADAPSPKKGVESGSKDTHGVRLPFDHPDNWAMGSKNRLKMLYPSFHSEQHRTAALEESRQKQRSPTGSPRSSCDEDDEESDEKWLRSRLRVHSDLVDQLDDKKARQVAHAKDAQKRLHALLQNQRDEAAEKKRTHEERLRNDLEYRLKHNSIKKPSVPGHKVKKVTVSSSCPKLEPSISKEARRIRRKLAASGVMPDKITSPDKIREKLKYVIKDLDRDVKSALDFTKRKLKKPKKGEIRSLMKDEDEMTPEERADQEKMEQEERILKEKRRSERRAALKNKLHFGTYSKEHIIHMREKFKNMDKDGSGSIDLDEFLEHQDASHISDHMASMFHAMDQDGDGNVSNESPLDMCIIKVHTNRHPNFFPSLPFERSFLLYSFYVQKKKKKNCHSHFSFSYRYHCEKCAVLYFIKHHHVN
jgi:WD40 repeat protein/Ca2+-binding EF-hand superfamily protein